MIRLVPVDGVSQRHAVFSYANYYDFCKNDYENQKCKTNTNLSAIIFMEVFGVCQLFLIVF